MRFDTRVYHRLAKIAGSGPFVLRGYNALRQECGRVPTLGELIDYIIAHRAVWHAERKAGRAR